MKYKFAIILATLLSYQAIAETTPTPDTSSMPAASPTAAAADPKADLATLEKEIAAKKDELTAVNERLIQLRKDAVTQSAPLRKDIMAKEQDLKNMQARLAELRAAPAPTPADTAKTDDQVCDRTKPAAPPVPVPPKLAADGIIDVRYWWMSGKREFPEVEALVKNSPEKKIRLIWDQSKSIQISLDIVKSIPFPTHITEMYVVDSSASGCHGPNNEPLMIKWSQRIEGRANSVDDAIKIFSTFPNLEKIGFQDQHSKTLYPKTDEYCKFLRQVFIESGKFPNIKEVSLFSPSKGTPFYGSGSRRDSVNYSALPTVCKFTKP